MIVLPVRTLIGIDLSKYKSCKIFHISILSPWLRKSYTLGENDHTLTPTQMTQLFGSGKEEKDSLSPKERQEHNLKVAKTRLKSIEVTR